MSILSWKSSLVVLCCSLGLGCADPGGEVRLSSAEAAMRSSSFYEDNPTYVSASAGDRFWRASTPEEQGLDAGRLEAGARSLEGTRSAMSFLVVRHGELAFERYFHGSARNQSNNIHSASKGIVSALAGLLVHHGYVGSLSSRLQDLLPAFSYDDPAKADITLRELLTMSAGFEWVEDETEYDIQEKANWVQAILDLPLSTSPGHRFHYCTGQSHLVSAIIAERTGMTTMEFGQRYLFEPLGVSVEHWGHDPQGYNSGGYNLYMTPRALAKFALLYLNRGQIEGRQILPAAWVDASLAAREDAHDGFRYGYYWWSKKIGGHTVHKLWGWGGQFAYMIPDADMIVVVTNNTRKTYPEMDGDEFVARHVVPAIVAR